MDNKRKANIGNGHGTPKNKRFKLEKYASEFTYLKLVLVNH
jgi:hypothetical protein